MKRGVSRRFVLGSLALVSGQAVLSAKAVAFQDPPRPIVPVYARGTAVKPRFPPLDLCASGEGNYNAYAELQKKLPDGYVFQAGSLSFSMTDKCPPEKDAHAPAPCPATCEVEHRSILCKEANVVCEKFKMMGTGSGLTRAGARRRALKDLEAGLDMITKTICDCGCLTWETK